ncbi:hypothetical protein GCM10025771_13850 [Niveibacterium umoris]|uniref:Uncharacterized protein n=1 Tax=Niveibacterium umoris TaxID=1193620 RepID=A0A840BTY4_9RHOO|nr:hypothetical protein [Niveibacterium umoris]
MSRPFLGRSAIVDIIKSNERTNAIQKREGLTGHPVRFTVCGCPDPNCGGWHTIETDRKIPSQEECAEIIKADNAARKTKKTKGQ